MRVTNPDYAFWLGSSGIQNLLAQLVDVGNVQIWQQSKDGKRNRNRPKPIKRPWSKTTDTQQIGRGPIPADEWATWWGDGSEE